MIMLQARNVKTLCSIIMMLVLYNYFEVDVTIVFRRCLSTSISTRTLKHDNNAAQNFDISS